MKEQRKISQEDLKRVVMEETAKFLAENRNTIIKRAHSRLRAEEQGQEKKQKDA